MSKEHSNSFLSNVLKLVSGSVFAQGLGVLVLPIISRFFSPDVIGVSTLFLTIVNLIAVVVCLGYEDAIMLPDSDEEASNLLGVCFCSVLIITILITIPILYSAESILSYLNMNTLLQYVYLIPVAVFINGLFLALNFWNSRTKHFGRLSVARVSSSVISNSTRVGFGFLGYVGANTLIYASLLGQFVTTSVLSGLIISDNGKLFVKSIRFKKIIEGYVRYWKFPVFRSWSRLLNTASSQLPIWILALLFSSTVVGYYALSRLVLGIPVTLIGTAIAQVFFQKASEIYRQHDDLAKVIESIFTRLVSIGFFPFILMILIGKEIFMVVFGVQWAEAGEYAQILSIALFFQFLFAPMMSVFAVVEKQEVHLMFDVILFIGRASALFIGGVIGDVKIALMLFTVVGVLYYMLFLIWLVSVLKISATSIWTQLRIYFLYSFPMFGILAILKWHLNLGTFWLFGFGIISGGAYYFLTLRKDETLKKPIKGVIQKAGFLKS